MKINILDEESSDSISESEPLCLQGQTKKRKRSKHVQSFVDDTIAMYLLHALYLAIEL